MKKPKGQEEIHLDFVSTVDKSCQNKDFLPVTNHVEGIRVNLIVDNSELRQFILPIETLNKLHDLKDGDLKVYLNKEEQLK